jgi:alkylhydroperoxidase family enzyme
MEPVDDTIGRRKAMARLSLILSQEEHPAADNEVVSGHLSQLWNVMFPEGDLLPDGTKKRPLTGYAILAHSPQLAINFLHLTNCVLTVGWARRRDIRELMIQTVNFAVKCEFGFESHLVHAQRSDLAMEQIAAIPYWRTTHLFNDEERLVIEYTLACIEGNVSDELFSKVAGRYGEDGAVEFTLAIGLWVVWAYLFKATNAQFTMAHLQSRGEDPAIQAVHGLE